MWKCLELLEMDGNGWNGWKWLEMAGHCCKLLEWPEMNGNGWKCREMAGMAGRSWKWLSILSLGPKYDLI